MKTRILCILIFLIGAYSMYAQNKQYTSTDFITKVPSKVFIGAILEAGSLNNDSYSFVNTGLNPVTISYSIPIKSIEIVPSYNNLINTIRKGLEQNGGAIKPNFSFSFITRELNSYEDLNILYGQQINTKSLLEISNTAKTQRTLTLVNISQSFFSVDIDLPEQLCSDTDFIKQYGENELVYIASLKFGRQVIVLIESPFDYAIVNSAVKDLLQNEDTSKIQKSMAVIANSSIRLLTIGADEVVIDPANPFQSVVDYMKREVSSNNFGSPISFSASYLSNNGVFVNKFSTR